MGGFQLYMGMGAYPVLDRAEISWNEIIIRYKINSTRGLLIEWKIVLYWIQYKKSLKYKVGCFWRFSYADRIN